MKTLPRAIVGRGHELVAEGPIDVALHMWASGQPLQEAKTNIFWLRRYELYEPDWQNIDWLRVDGAVFVNDWIREIVQTWLDDRGFTVPTYTIYNGIDVAEWTYRKREPGTKIGMACYVHPKKGLPLALQVLAALPSDYTLHVAGAIQDGATAEYVCDWAKETGRDISFYGGIPPERMDAWWDDKDYCLSASMTEGNPNNVIEAMAKGIKPLVHSWPGAKQQFGDWTWKTIDEAVRMIQDPWYDSATYRATAEERFGLNNIVKIVKLAEDIHAKNIG